MRCSCRKASLDCGCRECRGICANMYENRGPRIYYEETYVVIVLMQYDITLMYIALIGTIRWSNDVFVAAILNFREIFGLKYYYLVTK